VTAGLPSDDEPEPPIDRPEYVSATGLAFGPNANFIIRFNQPLQFNPAGFPPNWQIVFEGRTWNAFSARLTGVNAFIGTTQGNPDPGPNRVTYLATPPNVKALDDAAETLPFADEPFN
jgi:hypothetical protein